MSDQPKQQRLLGEILADIDALPLSRDPFQQMTEIKALDRLLREAEWDAGPGSRDEEFRQHPRAARVLLGILDRMLPVFDDAEFTWASQHRTRDLFPKDYYQVADPLFTFSIGEYLPGLPGYPEALVELVRRNPQAWSVEALLEWVKAHPLSSVNGVDIDDLIERLKRIEKPESVRRMACAFTVEGPLSEG
ncbi:MAG: hypothetical protein K2R98_33730 [Gemmataceae bacterium]|nr:hypothetical protein [Gemmataceae bacterium]